MPKSINYLDKTILRLVRGTAGIRKQRLLPLLYIINKESIKRTDRRIIADWHNQGKTFSSARVEESLLNLEREGLIRPMGGQGSTTICIGEGVPTIKLDPTLQDFINYVQKRRFHCCPWKGFAELSNKYYK